MPEAGAGASAESPAPARDFGIADYGGGARQPKLHCAGHYYELLARDEPLSVDIRAAALSELETASPTATHNIVR